MQVREGITWLGLLALQIALTWLAIRLFLPGERPPSTSSEALIIAGAAVLTGLLLQPEFNLRLSGGTLRWVLWCVLVAGVSSLLAMESATPQTFFDAVGRLGSAIFLLLLTATAVVQLLNQFLSMRRAMMVTLWLLMLLGTTPLWLGPVAELTAPDPAVGNLVLNVSPLAFLATAADFDFLRTPWFYEHSALGLLRYDYWPLSVFCGYYLVLAATAWLLIGWRLKRRRFEEGPDDEDPLGMEKQA